MSNPVPRFAEANANRASTAARRDAELLRQAIAILGDRCPPRYRAVAELRISRPDLTWAQLAGLLGMTKDAAAACGRRILCRAKISQPTTLPARNPMTPRQGNAAGLKGAALLREALDKLGDSCPPRYRMVAEARLASPDLSWSQLASSLGMTTGQAYNCHYRLLARAEGRSGRATGDRREAHSKRIAAVLYRNWRGLDAQERATVAAMGARW